VVPPTEVSLAWEAHVAAARNLAGDVGEQAPCYPCDWAMPDLE
jgi:hypothetical protein